jgi:hypothetical protein
MAYKQKGSPFQRNFKIGSPAKQMLKPRVAPTAAPMGAPAAPPPPPVDPAMVAQAAEAVKGQWLHHLWTQERKCHHQRKETLEWKLNHQ